MKTRKKIEAGFPPIASFTIVHFDGVFLPVKIITCGFEVLEVIPLTEGCVTKAEANQCLAAHIKNEIIDSPQGGDLTPSQLEMH